jgi:hypothetical protein
MGKNELSAHLEAYLLYIHQLAGGTLVKAAPTFKPRLIDAAGDGRGAGRIRGEVRQRLRPMASTANTTTFADPRSPCRGSPLA